MTLIPLQDGKVIFRSGKVGTEAECCCGQQTLYCCSCIGSIEAIDQNPIPIPVPATQQEAQESLDDSEQRCAAFIQGVLDAGYCSVVYCPGVMSCDEFGCYVMYPTVNLGFCGDIYLPYVQPETFYSTGTPNNDLSDGAVFGKLLCGECTSCGQPLGERPDGCIVYRDDCCKAGPHPSCEEMPENTESWYCHGGNPLP